MENDVRHLILRVSVKMLTPLIVLFAFYVLTHGEYGPGGGFQAGVLLAAAVIVYGLVFGPVAAVRLAPPIAAAALAAIGVTLYALTGVVGLAGADSFLDHNGIAALLQLQPSTGQHIGIVLVEWSVFFTVAGSLIGIFYAFLVQPAGIPDEEFEADDNGESAG
jgi:multicomponent Na+:H+ antiporter subunit B